MKELRGVGSNVLVHSKYLFCAHLVAHLLVFPRSAFGVGGCRILSEKISVMGSIGSSVTIQPNTIAK